MRGRVIASGNVHLQRWLCIHIHDDNRVCGQHEHMRCLWLRLQLRRGWRPTGVVFVLARLRVNRVDVKHMRIDVFHLPDDRLRRGKCVRRRNGATGRLHVQPRLRVDIHDDDRVCGQHGDVRCVRRRLQLHR